MKMREWKCRHDTAGWKYGSWKWTTSVTRDTVSKCHTHIRVTVKSHCILFWRNKDRSRTCSTIPDPLQPSLSQDWGSQPHPKTAIAIISGTATATDCKFGRYIHRSILTQAREKILEKWERGRIQGLSKLFQYPLLSQERVKLRTSSFVRTFLVSIGTKAHYKFREK